MMRSHPQFQPITDTKKIEVATKALLKATRRWGLAQKELAAILGISAASSSRLASRQRLIDLGSKEGEIALLLLRIYRSLDALVGGDDAKARLWLDSENHHLGEAPMALMRRVEGLVHVAQYLDAMRGKL